MYQNATYDITATEPAAIFRVESISEVDDLTKIFGIAEENPNGPFVAHGVRIQKIDSKPFRKKDIL